MMQYDILDELQKPGVELTCVVDAEVAVEASEALYGPVKGQVTLINAGGKVEAFGFVSTTVELTCSRCLTKHWVPIEIEIDEVCSLEAVERYDSVTAEEERSELISLRSGSKIDLSELVRQLAMLNTPWRWLCRPDCRGLCPVCGQNLNEGDCDCQRQQVDSRLAPLLELHHQ